MEKMIPVPSSDYPSPVSLFSFWKITQINQLIFWKDSSSRGTEGKKKESSILLNTCSVSILIKIEISQNQGTDSVKVILVFVKHVDMVLLTESFTELQVSTFLMKTFCSFHHTAQPLN